MNSSTPLSAESPSSAARHQTKLFELIDADFAERFDGMLATYVKGHRNFRKRITSGAASDSNAVTVGGRSYLHYASCQAHQCDSTTVDVLFDPASKRMAAKALDHCAADWLGEPVLAEKTVLEAQHHQSFPAAEQNCTGK